MDYEKEREKAVLKRSLKRNKTAYMVPKAGLEPARSCPRRILSPLRLPIPPLRRIRHKLYYHKRNNNATQFLLQEIENYVHKKFY